MAGVDELLIKTGLSYRQLDHYCRQGWLRPENPNPGSGHSRHWPARELRIARIMHRLVRAGIQPAVAAEAARRIVASGYTTVDIGPGVTVTVGGAT